MTASVVPPPSSAHTLRPAGRALAACRAVQAIAAAAFGVAPAELRAATRGQAAVAFARQAAMYLAHVALGLSYTEIGRAFGRDRTTAAHACALIEGRRDDPRIDALLNGLEHACQALTAPVAPRGEAGR